MMLAAAVPDAACGSVVGVVLGRVVLIPAPEGCLVRVHLCPWPSSWVGAGSGGCSASQSLCRRPKLEAASAAVLWLVGCVRCGQRLVPCSNSNGSGLPLFGLQMEWLVVWVADAAPWVCGCCSGREGEERGLGSCSVRLHLWRQPGCMRLVGAELGHRPRPGWEGCELSQALSAVAGTGRLPCCAYVGERGCTAAVMLTGATQCGLPAAALAGISVWCR
jgi:hypothetical protein